MGLGLAAGLIIGRNLDVCLRTLKLIDARLASTLPASLQNTRWVAYSALSLGIAAGLAHHIERKSDSKPQPPKVEKGKQEEKQPVEVKFKPALRQVENTNRVPTELEKQEVREVLKNCNVIVPKNDQNKEFLFWHEMIQWVKAIAKTQWSKSQRKRSKII
jgi:hypothetical protein